ncbi:MAG: hypothetical protein GY765_38425, partial [bacterium]|nr:hypothetical protein [bacterium]
AKKELSKNKTTIDTRLFDDGKYQLKVVADDGPSNPPTMALSHQLVNTSFLIDSTAPLLTGFTRQGKKIAFTVTDAVSIISHVRYSYDGKMWFPLFPVDKISDSKKESYDFVLKDIVGKKIIFIKVADEYKNSKVFQEEL